jgi:hypothetical protein
MNTFQPPTGYGAGRTWELDRHRELVTTGVTAWTEERNAPPTRHVAVKFMEAAKANGFNVLSSRRVAPWRRVLISPPEQAFDSVKVGVIDHGPNIQS